MTCHDLAICSDCTLTSPSKTAGHRHPPLMSADNEWTDLFYFIPDFQACKKSPVPQGDLYQSYINVNQTYPCFENQHLKFNSVPSDCTNL